MSKHTLGIDLGVQASHVATLCDERGEVIGAKRRVGNRHQELVAVVAQVGDCDQLTVVMEPTRNAWVPVAAHFMAVGAYVVLVPPQRSADHAATTPSTPRTTDWTLMCWPGCRCSIPRGSTPLIVWVRRML